MYLCLSSVTVDHLKARMVVVLVIFYIPCFFRITTSFDWNKNLSSFLISIFPQK